MNAQDKRVRLSVEEMRIICSLRGKDINSYKKADGTKNYRVKLTDQESAAIGRARLKVPPRRLTLSSLKGYDAYAMDKGMDFQPPSQNLILLDSRYGFCMYQQVFPF